jgi:hypothetical protein
MGRPPYGARATCESCKCIDVRRWYRGGWLSTGQHFTTSWTFGSEPAGAIQGRTESGSVVLTWQTRSCQTADWKPITQRVPITWTDCHFGGRRPWFICSVYRDGRYCGRRVAILYGAGAYFACRRCHGLAYASQQEAVRELVPLASRANASMCAGGIAEAGSPRVNTLRLHGRLGASPLAPLMSALNPVRRC